MSTSTEEIKARLDIVDVLSEYIQLNQSGMNFKAVCPFHKEKTPSFFVSPEKQIWHCFGCGSGGDIFEFIKKIEGLEFPEALRILADKANVNIDYNYNPELNSQKTKILDILDETVNYYQQNLLNKESAKIARDYLKDRKISKEAVDIFKLGYSEDSWSALLKHLKDKGFTEKDIEASGMILKSSKGNFNFYDRFRGRLMFPINNVFGQTVGFTARALKDDDLQGKYVNSPQTASYDKSSILYNLDLAKLEIKSKNYTILVEGQMDVISSYMAGVKNVVASSGTALTPEQVKLLRRYSENLIIAYDGDSAGVKASFRIIDNALKQGMNIKVVSLAKGIDPDDLIKEDSEKWRQKIKEAQPLMDFVFDKTLSTVDLSQVFQKKQAAQKLLIFISKISDEIEREVYLKRMSDLFNIEYEILSKKIKEVLEKKQAKNFYQEDSKEKDYQPSEKNKREEVLKEIIALAVNFSDNLEYLASNLENEYINSVDIDELYKSIVIYYTKNNKLNIENMKSNLNSEQLDLLNIITFIFENQYADYDQNKSFLEIKKLVKDYKKIFLSEKLKKLEYLIKKAEREGDQEKSDQISAEFINYTQKLKVLE
ncbi:DNA primase [bacterium]|nr:DNA primase [bacterium]